MIAYRSLSDQAYEVLQQKIQDGEITPGQRLIEEKLALEIGVSRTTVKRALTKLLEEGLLRRHGRKGIYVKQYSQKEFLEIYDAREVLEGLAARIAAQVADENSLIEFREIFKIMESAVQQDDTEAYTEADSKFHSLLIECAKNQIVSQIMSTFRLRIETFNIGLIRAPKETILEHHQIIRALENHNPETAERLLREHIHRSRQKLVDVEDSSIQYTRK